MMRSVPLLLLLGPLGTASAQKTDFAGDLVECAKANSIDSCLKSTLEKLRQFMPTGIPELGLRPTEPLNIENLVFITRPGGGPVVVNSQFHNVTVKGLSNFVTRDIHADLQRRELFISMFVPEVFIRGLYNITGKVIVVDVQGHGPFDCALSGVAGQGSGRIVAEGPAGNRTLSVRDIKIDFEIEDAEVTMYNLFDGKYEALAENVNRFINQNAGIIIGKVKPQITDEVSKLVQMVFRDAFSRLPVERYLDQFPLQNPAPGSSRSFRSFRNQRRRSEPSFPSFAGFF